MKVREAMTSDVGFCQPTTSLAAAAILMWQRDCGVVPVVDEQQKVVGMITDRDICMAAATKNRPISEILINEVISGKVKSCAPNDDLEDALKKMKKNQLRRLPVVNKDNALVGILSISDVLRNAKEVSRKKLVSALQEISHFHAITLHAIDSEAVEDDDAENQEDDETDNTDSKFDLADDDSDDNTDNQSSNSNGETTSDSSLSFGGNSHDDSENVYGTNDQAQL